MYAEFIATLATTEIHHSRIRVGETTIIPVNPFGFGCLGSWGVCISFFLYVAMWVCIRISGEGFCWTHKKYHNTHATWFRKHSAFTRWWKHRFRVDRTFRWCVESQVVGPPLEKASPRKRRAKGAKGALGLISKGALFFRTLLGSTGNPNPNAFLKMMFPLPKVGYMLVPWRVFDLFELTKTMSKPTPVFGGLSYHLTQRWGFAIHR